MENNQGIQNVAKQQGKREAGLFVTAAMQGGGKTTQNMHIIYKYTRDKLATKVKGRKCLILDTNGEFNEEEFSKNGIPNFNVKKLAVSDVKDWCRSNVVECRRIDMKSLPADDKIKILNYVISVIRNILFVIEDINTISLDVTHLENVVQNIVNLRHKAVDVLTSYQTLRAVEPRILQNSRWLRLHYQLGSVEDIKGKLPCDKEVFKIAQLIINAKYYGGDQYFFLYIYTLKGKIEGDFTKKEFMEACKKYLMLNKKVYKEEMDISGCTMDQAIENQSRRYFKQFYGN